MATIPTQRNRRGHFVPPFSRARPISNGTYAKQNGRTFHGFGNDLVRAMIKWIYGYGFEDVMTGYRAMSRPFVKTFPVLSEGFQIETELSIHAVDRRWRIVNIPVKYRDRPNGSVSKLNTVRDGLKVIAMIGTLFKDYRPLKFFSLVALAFCIGGLCAGMPVVSEYLATGLVPRLPTAILAVALMFIATLSLATGFILDAVAKVERKLRHSQYAAHRVQPHHANAVVRAGDRSHRQGYARNVQRAQCDGTVHRLHNDDCV